MVVYSCRPMVPLVANPAPCRCRVAGHPLHPQLATTIACTLSSMCCSSSSSWQPLIEVISCRSSSASMTWLVLLYRSMPSGGVAATASTPARGVVVAGTSWLSAQLCQCGAPMAACAIGSRQIPGVLLSGHRCRQVFEVCSTERVGTQIRFSAALSKGFASRIGAPCIIKWIDVFTVITS